MFKKLVVIIIAISILILGSLSFAGDEDIPRPKIIESSIVEINR